MSRPMIPAFLAFSFAVACADTPSVSKEDFTLQPILGEKPFSLSEARGRYVALHFLLKTECPVCLRHTRTWHQNRPTIAGVEQVFIKPDSPEEIKQWANNLSLEVSPPIYHDPGAGLAEAFEIPDGYKFHGESVHYPAFVLLGPDGKELSRFVGKTNTDRYSWDDFVEAMVSHTRTAGMDHYLVDEAGVALQGYDPVAYIDGTATEGNPEIYSTYGGIRYQFSSMENRDRFNQSPTEYIPPFGGWSTDGLAAGDKVAPAPEQFRRIDGKVVLLSKETAAEIRELIPAAEETWNRLTAGAN